MIKNHRRILSCLIALCVTVTLLCTPASAAPALPEKNDTPRHQACTVMSKEAKAYYAGEYSAEKLFSLSGASDNTASDRAMQNNALFDALHDLMADTQTYCTAYSGYAAGSLAYYWARTDATADTDSYIMFYSDIPSGSGVSLNREHVWPKSRASFTTSGGGADLHHLRPAIASLNQAKSDHLFGNINGTYSEGVKEGVINGEVMYYVDTAHDLFECKDDVKGDVARILLYVYCRWEQPNLYTVISDPQGESNNGKKVVESLDTLLSWCAQDPVDTWEMKRNDLVQQVQGNRNVFIDYPELAWRMFGEAAPAGMTTPTSDSADPPVNDEICGDADGDGTVTVLDATRIQRVLADLTRDDDGIVARRGDVDGDGLNILDATAIQRWLAGLSTGSPIGKPIST